nr:MAG TPA: hypothetical protein [Caudoviricetes sp.]
MFIVEHLGLEPKSYQSLIKEFHMLTSLICGWLSTGVDQKSTQSTTLFLFYLLPQTHETENYLFGQDYTFLFPSKCCSAYLGSNSISVVS